MLKLIIITAIGNYAVEMVPELEDPTNDELMALFLETKRDVESGCFMEGWTPNDKPGSPTGVFAIAHGLDILAYHVERVEDIPDVAPAEPAGKILPYTAKIDYLGNTLTAQCVEKEINNTHLFYCYSINGEPPTDVLDIGKATAVICQYVKDSEIYSDDDFLLIVSDDEQPKNFSQACEFMEYFEKEYQNLCTKKTGKAWTGWKDKE